MAQGTKTREGIETAPGLEGAVVTTTRVGDVRGREGFFHYRQHSAVELAERCTLEEVWHLFAHERLPDAGELAAFSAHTAALRSLPPRTSALLPSVAALASDPLDALRSAVSLAAAELGLTTWLDTGVARLQDDALRLVAVMPTLVAALHRLRGGSQPLAPDPELGYAADYLRMATGRSGDPALVRALEQYLILTIDHGFNASTFTARVITSTGGDLGAALTGAIGALAGPLHGGAPSRALELLDEIGTPDRTEAVIRRRIAAGERIMGFGHRVYRTEDPRARLLRAIARELGGARVALAAGVERTVVDVLAELKPERELHTNVEFYAGVVLERVGLPPDLFTPTFAVSRTIGWCAHVVEQTANNRLIRPSARYVGPSAPQPVR